MNLIVYFVFQIKYLHAKFFELKINASNFAWKNM